MNEEVDVQPNGIRIETTLEVVSHILNDAEFSQGVAEHNGWAPASQQDTALLFLTSRYQWTVSLLSTQTQTLRAELDTVNRQLEALLGR